MRRWAFPTLAAVLGSGFFFLQYVRWEEPLGLDQGLFACFGRWVPRGWLPYRDIWDSKPPGIFYTYVLAFSLFGEGVRSLWTFEAVWIGATALVIFLLGRKIWGGWEGLASAFFFVFFLYSPTWGGFWARAQAEVFLTFPMAAAAYFAFMARGVVFPLLTGVFAGLASLYKLPALLPAAGWPAFWWARKGETLRKSAWMLVGIVLPWTGVLGCFLAKGAIGDLVEAVWTYSREYASVVGWGHSWLGTLWGGIRGLVSGSPFTVFWGVVGMVLIGRELAWWLGPWLALALVGVVLQRQLAGYHFLLVASPLAIASGYGLARTARGLLSASRLRKLLPASGLSLGLIFLWVEGIRWREAYGPGWAYRRGALTREAYIGGFDRGFFSPLEQEKIARYVRRHTEEGDAILVWGLSPGVYFLSERRPVTRYPFHHLLLTEAPLSLRLPGLEERRRRFLKRLRTAPPAYILVGVMDPNGFEPLDSYTQMLRFPEFHRFVSEGYEYETRIGHFLLFRRRS